jgi:hypothetical protein
MFLHIKSVTSSDVPNSTPSLFPKNPITCEQSVPSLEILYQDFHMKTNCSEICFEIFHKVTSQKDKIKPSSQWHRSEFITK